MSDGHPWCRPISAGSSAGPQRQLQTHLVPLPRLFLEQVLGLEETSYHRFAGPEVERTIGLPAGAGLDIRIFGDPAYAYGRLEIVQYEGVTGADLYPRARPPAGDRLRRPPHPHPHP